MTIYDNVDDVQDSKSLHLVVNLQHIVPDHLLKGVGLLGPVVLHGLQDVLAHAWRVERGCLSNLSSAVNVLMASITLLVQGEPQASVRGQNRPCLLDRLLLPVFAICEAPQVGGRSP